MTFHYVLGKQTKGTIGIGTGIQVLPPQSQAKISNRGCKVKRSHSSETSRILPATISIKIPFPISPFHFFVCCLKLSLT
uniref:Uncharacterized protein n=1 Tax=Mus musculus TaxID=10090 RepID=Q3TNJ6_MOUSE|nr:unnamed protein product [Mus musculus]